MTGFGVLLPRGRQLWRNFADIVSRLTCVFATGATRSMLRHVAGPSSKLPATFRKNRYPSPSTRSGLSRVRPHPFWVQPALGKVNAVSALCGQSMEKAFAKAYRKGETDPAIQFRMREGSSKCKRRPGLSPRPPCLASRPVSKLTPSAGLQAPRAALSLRTPWVAMPPLALWSAVPAESSATTSASADNTFLSRRMARGRSTSWTIGVSPVVFFVLQSRRDRPAATI